MGLDATLDYVIDDFIGAHPQTRARDRRTVESGDGVYELLKRKVVLQRIARDDSDELDGVENADIGVASAPSETPSHLRSPREERGAESQNRGISDVKRRASAEEAVPQVIIDNIVRREDHEPVDDLEAGEVSHDDMKRDSSQNTRHNVVKRVLSKLVNYEARRDAPPITPVSFGSYQGLTDLMGKKIKRDYSATTAIENNRRSRTGNSLDVKRGAGTGTKPTSARLSTVDASSGNKNQHVPLRRKKSSKEAKLDALKSYQGKALSRSKRLQDLSPVVTESSRGKLQSRTKRIFLSDPRLRSPLRVVSSQVAVNSLRLEPSFTDQDIADPSMPDRGDQIFDDIIADTMIPSEELVMDDRVPDVIGSSRKKREASGDVTIHSAELAMGDKISYDIFTPRRKREASGTAMVHNSELAMDNKMLDPVRSARKKREASDDVIVPNEELAMDDKMLDLIFTTRQKREASVDATVHAEKLMMDDEVDDVIGSSRKKREAYETQYGG